ncbi:MAG TPA: hypothetical protein H9911_02950 [Candidatus Mediterraneibacter tabaqchaliae]|uniref:Uncharacterized protein n=1 Tax=Candidatus Mediterraneibacter tabaqchaliae TaxID=2838689 RepID=A0A9D2R4E4_9FIRM|nr:hypothetical protein [Candidatus Mediterraneibacter tabaqchaliae]
MNRKEKNRSRRESGKKKTPLSRNGKVLILVCAAALLAGAAVWWALEGGHGKENSGRDRQTADTDRAGEKREAQDSAGDDGAKSGEEAKDGGNAGSSGTGSGENSAIGFDPDIREEMSLPYTVPGTQLVIDRVDSYSGVYIEDGSDEDVEDIFAIHVQNQGENVEYSSINLEVGGKQLNFEISDLPAGSGISVLESSRTPYESGAVLYRGSQTAYIDEFDMMSAELGIIVGEDNGVTVTNLTDRDIPCIRIFYKFVQEDEYLGGITYTAKIEELEGNGTTTVYPSHFSAKGSRIMMVRTYDTAG